MADSLVLEQLKAARTTAKRQFTRLANSVSRMHATMTEDELRDSFRKLSIEANKVLEANDDIEAQHTEESGADELNEQQKADINKAASDCLKKLDELKDLIFKTAWEKYGEEKLNLAVEAAEEAAERVAAISPSENKAAFDFMIEHLEKLFTTASELNLTWKCWAPPAEQQALQSRMRELRKALPKLTARKAEFLQVSAKEERLPTTSTSHAPAIQLKPVSLPKFPGTRREFYRWRNDWESLQKQGEPTGSQEVKKLQLLDSIDERTARDLRLSTYATADEIFRVLNNRYGNKTTIAIEIVEELQRLPPVKAHQPKKIIELIQLVEKALIDLSDLGNTGAIKNPLVTKSIEGKLPEVLKKEWLLYAAEKGEGTKNEERFDSLLTFLKSQETIYEQLDQLRDEDPHKQKYELRQTRATMQSSSHPLECVVCGESKHQQKLYFCKRFRALKLKERKDAVRRLGACNRCLEVHKDFEYCKNEFLCQSPDCRDQQSKEHHFYLCPRAVRSRGHTAQRTRVSTVGGDNRSYTEAQKDFVQKLSPELAAEFRHVFCNSVTRTPQGPNQSLLAENGLKEWPVILMLLQVTSNAGQKIGTLIDLGSDTNYITHRAAKRLNLKSEDITLVVHGVGGMRVQVKTKRYLLKIRVRADDGTFKPRLLICYGLNNIADVREHVTAETLHKFFPDVPVGELERPREVDLLISHKEGRLVPQKVCSIGDLVLWDGPLGKTVAGTHPRLFGEGTVAVGNSRTHFAKSMSAATPIPKALTPIKRPVQSQRRDSRTMGTPKWEAVQLRPKEPSRDKTFNQRTTFDTHIVCHLPEFVRPSQRIPWKGRVGGVLSN